MAVIKKKAQRGGTYKPTADSTEYYKKQMNAYANMSEKSAKTATLPQMEAISKGLQTAGNNMIRQNKKGKPGYTANGFPKKKCGGKVSKKKK